MPMRTSTRPTFSCRVTEYGHSSRTSTTTTAGARQAPVEVLDVPLALAEFAVRDAGVPGKPPGWPRKWTYIEY
jgi:hypothetical protein